MRKIAGLVVLMFSLPVSAQQIPEVYLNHAWVDGVYWNRGELPGWGFFVDVQETTLFGAIYGYSNGAPTFITLQGELASDFPFEFRGDVYSVTNNGTQASDVGDFTWRSQVHAASPAALLSISSNILNKSNLPLVRFSYVEDDKVDMFTAANWDVITRVSGISFGDSLAIYDDRIEEEGVTFALVVNNADPDQIGVIGYFPPPEDAYGMGVQIDEDTMELFIFYASDTEMFGRGWLVDDGAAPTGNGYYFHASADTYQNPYEESGLLTASATMKLNKPASDSQQFEGEESMKHSLARAQEGGGSQMFSEDVVRSVFDKLKSSLESKLDSKGGLTQSE